MFTPELWGQVERFQNFWSTTYVFDDREQRAVRGVGAHFEKGQVLLGLAKKLRPNLETDRTELEQRGVTPAANARELATVVEAAILELYSCIDCTVKVLRAIYGRGTRGFKDSTRGLFQNIDKMSGSFPPELKPIIAGAQWYGGLRHLRDELTHLATGSVHANNKTGVIWYIHQGLKNGTGPLIINDIFEWFDITTGQVNAFLGAVFHYLNSTLADKPMFQICGMVRGRVLHRWVSPAGELTCHSGGCGAWVWFEQPENPTCPFKEVCGAYRNKAPPEGWET